MHSHDCGEEMELFALLKIRRREKLRKPTSASAGTQSRLVAALAILGAIACATEVGAGEKFARLSGVQIRAKIAGMVLTDDVHWRDVYERNGTVKSHSMGHERMGKWRVEDDELCVEFEKEPVDCHEIWLSGAKVELRRAGSSFPIDAVLRKPGDQK